ncbi:SRPBCC family protein [Polyangium aurulentum]|uniref:SRPBCC family protein n=1 Tax=Polyangium aurulentum TaxID=2567896 RepID=UPI0010ADD815|nr:SRPBCC family protein [Polyangium aurulentum]UQA59787.1 SRPBCC family protein [Polyangium aurulentum]
MNRPSFVYVTYIATTPEKLWTALTDGKFTQEYWGGRRVESDWKPGSPVFFRTTNGAPDVVRAKVIEVDPPSRLVMSWTREIAPQTPLPPATRVIFTIDPAGPVNVKLTVVHEEFEPGSEVEDGLRNGWPAILSSLKSLLETGEALDISKRWAKAGN